MQPVSWDIVTAWASIIGLDIYRPTSYRRVGLLVHVQIFIIVYYGAYALKSQAYTWKYRMEDHCGIATTQKTWTAWTRPRVHHSLCQCLSIWISMIWLASTLFWSYREIWQIVNIADIDISVMLFCYRDSNPGIIFHMLVLRTTWFTVACKIKSYNEMRTDWLNKSSL